LVVGENGTRIPSPAIVRKLKSKCPLAEIELANGCRLRVCPDIATGALHRLVTALKATG
jgi:hypothetical protein